MRNAQQKLERSEKTRVQILEEAAQGECIDGCWERLNIRDCYMKSCLSSLVLSSSFTDLVVRKNFVVRFRYYIED